MANKLTKKDKFEMLKNITEVAQNEMLMEFINHEIELLDRKNGSKKPTAKQVANENLAKAILANMERDRLYTITELQKEVPECADLSNQRVSAIVRKMVDEGIVNKTVDKRKSLFSIA